MPCICRAFRSPGVCPCSAAVRLLHIYAEKVYAPCSGFSLNSTRVPLFSGKNIPVANSRVLRGLRKLLSVSGLCLPAVSQASFRAAMKPLSGPDIACFVC